MAKIKKLHQDYEGSSSVVLERVKPHKKVIMTTNNKNNNNQNSMVAAKQW